jgi:hypothetical protein
MRKTGIESKSHLCLSYHWMERNVPLHPLLTSTRPKSQEKEFSEYWVRFEADVHAVLKKPI